MKDFVKINTLFPNKEQRTIDELQKIYSNQPRLVEEISSITKDILSNENINNKKILLKPNWVKHSKKESDAICLRTNDNFLLAVLEVILNKKPASVVIGDAPIQGCYWDQVVTKELIESINALSIRYQITVIIKDFRRVTFDPNINKPVKNLNPLSDYVIFDLGKESYLESISLKDKNPFRVNNYNPDRLAESHGPGAHKYCISKELFYSDIIISLPKVKTHQKAGITNALKNLVGLNGDKDYLPHHRFGGTGFGGDCYPGKNYLRYFSEIILDQANRNIGKKSYWFLSKLSALLFSLSFPSKEQSRAASWYGNDTTWRMTLDLNKIVFYAKLDGTLSTTPQRSLFNICDGIIGGQGDGPLHPDPLELGIIAFSNHALVTDLAMAKIMSLPYQKIPLLREGLSFIKTEGIELSLNGKPININELDCLAIKATPPPGWVKYLNTT